MVSVLFSEENRTDTIFHLQRKIELTPFSIIRPSGYNSLHLALSGPTKEPITCTHPIGSPTISLGRPIRDPRGHPSVSTLQAWCSAVM
jgi:hypothetical protein